MVFAKEPSTSSYPSYLPVENRKPSNRLMEMFLSRFFEKISITNLSNTVLFQFLSNPSLPCAPEAPAAGRRPPNAHHHPVHASGVALHRGGHQLLFFLEDPACTPSRAPSSSSTRTCRTASRTCPSASCPPPPHLRWRLMLPLQPPALALLGPPRPMHR